MAQRVRGRTVIPRAVWRAWGNTYAPMPLPNNSWRPWIECLSDQPTLTSSPTQSTWNQSRWTALFPVLLSSFIDTSWFAKQNLSTLNIFPHVPTWHFIYISPPRHPPLYIIKHCVSDKPRIRSRLLLLYINNIRRDRGKTMQNKSESQEQVCC